MEPQGTASFPLRSCFAWGGIKSISTLPSANTCIFSSAKVCGRGRHSAGDSRALEVKYLVATHHMGLQESCFIACLSQTGFGDRGAGSDFVSLVQAELNPCLEILSREGRFLGGCPRQRAMVQVITGQTAPGWEWWQ